jgi:hypothetical protein
MIRIPRLLSAFAGLGLPDTVAEAFHREQRAVHAGEYEPVARHYEAFKASAEGAAEITSRVAPPAPAREEPLPP